MKTKVLKAAQNETMKALPIPKFVEHFKIIILREKFSLKFYSIIALKRKVDFISKRKTTKPKNLKIKSNHNQKAVVLKKPKKI